jgi:hypothetical protein
MATHFEARLLFVIIPSVVFGLWVGVIAIPSIIEVVVPVVVRTVVG